MRRFDGRTVLVVGGGHGIGRAVSERLAEEGARVAIADLDLSAAESVVARLHAAGCPAVAIACDIIDGAGVSTAVESAVQHFGKLDVLVNAAGGDRAHPEFAETDDATWQALTDLNLTGVVRCIRAALPHLFAAPTGGAVVTIGSINGMVTWGASRSRPPKLDYKTLRPIWPRNTATVVCDSTWSRQEPSALACGTPRPVLWSG